MTPTDTPPDNTARRLVLGATSLAAFAALAGTTASAADAQVYVIAELVAKPGSEAALRDLMVAFAAGSRKEPGCVSYKLMEDAKAPGRFLTYEVWADQAAIDAHMVTPEIKAAVPKLTGILAKPFTQAFLTGLS